VGSSPEGLAFDGANIWVSDFFGDALIKVRASDGVVLGTYGLFEPIYVACDGASVWVTNEIGDVTKFRGSDGAKEATIDLGTSALGGIIFDGTNIWLAAPGSNGVYELRPSDGRIVGAYTVGEGPSQLAFDGANIWVTNGGDDTVTKLRASDGHELFTVNAGISPLGTVLMARIFGWLTHIPAASIRPARLRS
jgi:hypothetical protein